MTATKHSSNDWQLLGTLSRDSDVVPARHRITGIEGTAHRCGLSLTGLEQALGRRLAVDSRLLPKLLDFGPLENGSLGYITQALTPVDPDELIASWATFRDMAAALLATSSAAHAQGVFHGCRSVSSLYRTQPRRRDVVLFEGWLLDAGEPLDGAGELPEAGYRDEALAVLSDLLGIGNLLRELLGRAAKASGDRVQPPNGFNAWLAAMTAADPSDRPPSAMAARAWLLEIDRLRRAVPQHDDYRRPPADLPSAGKGASEQDERTARHGDQFHRSDAPALLRVARPPIIGRGNEQRQLWNAFLAAVHGRRTLFLLRGRGGLGKTSLSRWLERQIIAGDYAGTLWLAHPNRGTPLSVALTEALAMSASDPSMRAQQMHRFLHRLRANTVSTRKLLALLTNESKPMSQRQQADVATLFFTAITKERPLVLFLDDVHHSIDTLRALENLLVRQPKIKLLVVATLRPGERLLNPEIGPILTGIGAMTGVRALDLKPLQTEAVETIATRYYHFAPKASAAMVRAAEGVPLFAVQWAERTLSAHSLSKDEDGFSASSGDLAAIPEAASNLFGDQIARAAAAVPHSRQKAVETLVGALAILGPALDAETLTSMKRVEPWGGIHDLLDALVRERILVPHHGGLRFDHGLFHEEVLERSEGDPEAQALATETLVELARLGNRKQLGNLVDLLIKADKAESALGYLWVAVDDSLAFGRIDEVRQQLDLAESIVAGIDPEQAASSAARLQVLRADHELQCHRPAEALELIEAIKPGASFDPQLAARAQLIHALSQEHRDGAEATSERLASLVAVATGLESSVLFGRAMVAAIDALLTLDQRDDAAASIARALDELSDFEAQEAGLRARVLGQRAQLEIRSGMLASAQASLTEAIRLDRITGNEVSLNLSMSQLGDLCMAAKHPKQAAKLYRTAAQQLMAVQRNASLTPTIGLAFVGVELDDAEAVGRQLEQCFAVTNPGDTKARALIAALRAWHGASESDWDAVEASAAYLAGPAALSVRFDLRVARCVGRAAILVARTGRQQTAQTLADFAATIFDDLERNEEGDALRQRFLSIIRTVPSVDAPPPPSQGANK